MTITPNPVPDDRPVRNRYDWTTVVLGEWQNWLNLDGDDSVTNEEALRAATRVRVAALHYAKRQGYDLESRRLRHGRILDLRFTDPTPFLAEG